MRVLFYAALVAAVQSVKIEAEQDDPFNLDSFPEDLAQDDLIDRINKQMLGQDYDDDNEQDYIAGIKKEYNKAQGKIKQLGISNKNSPFAKDLKGDLVKDDEKRKAKKYKAEQASDKLKDD